MQLRRFMIYAHYGNRVCREIKRYVHTSLRRQRLTFEQRSYRARGRAAGHQRNARHSLVSVSNFDVAVRIPQPVIDRGLRVYDSGRASRLWDSVIGCERGEGVLRGGGRGGGGVCSPFKQRCRVYDTT
jgi:hypothetical protein